MKQLIPLGSITSDPIGTERYMVVNDYSTAAEMVVIYPYNFKTKENKWLNIKFTTE